MIYIIALCICVTLGDVSISV